MAHMHATDDGRSCLQEVKTQHAQVDLHMMLYLQEEGGGKEKNALFVASHEHIVALERNICDFRKAEQASLRALHEASAARDRASRQHSLQVRLCACSGSSLTPAASLTRPLSSCMHTLAPAATRGQPCGVLVELQVLSAIGGASSTASHWWNVRRCQPVVEH
jgi:hypothetical protein